MTTSQIDQQKTDFIRTIVNEQLKEGRYTGVVTRFPPEPNGYLHIGHAKSICLNFGIARDYDGRCHLRMDDTDPTKESMEYVHSIQNDVRWLGFDWGPHMYYASDYFGALYEHALKLIQAGKAYVCSLNEEEIRKYRGTVTEPGKDSPYRSRSIEENMDLFTRMRNGEFKDGEHVLRARIDMTSPNMKMRDPLLYRIRHAHHYRTGDNWCIYPMYDFAHCLSDAMEDITHSICTLEFENNRELYDWILDACEISEPRPHQYEFARLNLNYTVMSKRKLLELVEKKYVSGWDDPRLQTISGLRRRGYTPEAIRAFCEAIGVAKANSVVDMAQLEHCIRDDLNFRAPRVMAIIRPLKVVLTNYPEGQSEELEASYWPHDVPKTGSRNVPFSRELYIEQDDFMENPPAGYYRLAPGQEVRLRSAYIIRCDEVVKDAQGNITELRCTYDPTTKSGEDTSGKKVKGTIHWVSAQHAVSATVRLYDRLFTVENPDIEGHDYKEFLNPNSLEVLEQCYVEPSLIGTKPGSHFQFERLGYFVTDLVDSNADHLVFNRVVTLKDSWGKQAQKTEEKQPQPAKAPTPAKSEPKQPSKSAPVSRELTPEMTAKMTRYQQEFKLGEEDARLLAEDPEVSQFFESAATESSNPQGLAKWINNELLRVLKERSLADLPITPKHLAELVALVDAGTVSASAGKEVLEQMVQSGKMPGTLVEEMGLKQISDPSALEPIIDQVIASNPDNLAKYREGKTSLFGFFVGQVLKATGGKANPQLVNDLLKQKLS